MTATPLALVGAGGFSRETIELVHAVNDARPDSWDLLGVVDDDPHLTGTRVNGRPVLGPVDWLLSRPNVHVAVTVGNPRNYASRRAIVERLARPPERYATLVHPAAVVPRSACIGVGTVIHATTVLTADVTVGAHVAVMPGVILTHDDVVEDYATFGAGVRVAGGTTVGMGAYVGSGALVREGLTVGAWSLVGMGAVVTRSIPPGELWMGAPAHFVRASPHADLASPQ